MRTGISLHVSTGDRRRLATLVKDRNTPQKHVWRAEIVLLSAEADRHERDHAPDGQVARPASGAGRSGSWRRASTASCATRRGPRASRRWATEVAARIVALTLDRPAGRDHALDRRDDGRSGWRLGQFGAAHLARAWPCSRIGCASSSCPTIPKFVAKLRDIVGLYVDPPAHAIVLSVDEKSQIQALDRTQPGLPMKKGRGGTMTHDYKRHGTTTLFAALNVLDGTVIGRNMQRHRHQEFIRFLNAVEAEVPAGKVVHAILDNYATHKHPKVRRWLARAPALDLPLHADLVLVAQRRRRLLRQADQADD